MVLQVVTVVVVLHGRQVHGSQHAFNEQSATACLQLLLVV
jgi:hypothetical protein